MSARDEVLVALHQADRALVRAPMHSWVDEVRQVVEQRLGVPAGDEAVLDDPEYVAALKLLGQFDKHWAGLLDLIERFPKAAS